MSRLADELAKLSDPTPKLLDPEDDINVETTARVVERFDEGSADQSELSRLRQTTAPLLEDLDARYVGKRISRKSFDQTGETGSESSSENEESEDDAEVDEDLNSFKRQVREITDVQDSSYNEQLEDGMSSEAQSSGSGSEEEEDEDVDSDGKSDTDVESGEEGQETEEDMFQKFSHIDVNEEIEKGKAVEAQLGMWNKLCECRIRFQKSLAAANRLPQFDTWNDFKMKGDENYANALEKGLASLKSLLDSMLELQSRLLQSNPEINSFVTTADSQPAQESDEEIPSGSESESREETIVESKKRSSKRETKKRKLKLDEYSDILAKRFKAFVPYRNSVIQKWDDNTRLITGRMTQKSFSAFNQSALKQIDQILQDKPRLIRRTQLKRSVYNVLGKNEDDENTQCPSEGNSEEGHIKRDEHLNHYDPEIFDDDDFYHVLLKDVIESKSVGMDPDLLRTHMEIQKNRRKMKKKVDTKASKGRKLRYDPHPKMVSFAARIPSLSSYSEGRRDDLFKRMFNQNSAIPAL